MPLRMGADLYSLYMANFILTHFLIRPELASPPVSLDLRGMLSRDGHSRDTRGQSDTEVSGLWEDFNTNIDVLRGGLLYPEVDHPSLAFRRSSRSPHSKPLAVLCLQSLLQVSTSVTIA